MRNKVSSMLYIPAILLLELSIYIALGLYKKSVGCRGITVDCYIPEAEFAKEMQVIIVTLTLLTLAWFALAVIAFARKCLSKYIKKSND